MTERPLDLLMACHARIRRYCGGLQALCEVEPGDPRIQATALACHRYFGEALALHGQDEDRSVFPRLQPHLDAAQRRAVAELHEQHQQIDACTPDVLLALEDVSALDRAQMRAVFEPYWSLLLTHIEREEQTLFPVLEELTAREEQEIVGEIRGRRGGRGGG